MAWSIDYLDGEKEEILDSPGILTRDVRLFLWLLQSNKGGHAGGSFIRGRL